MAFITHVRLNKSAGALVLQSYTGQSRGGSRDDPALIFPCGPHASLIRRSWKGHYGPRLERPAPLAFQVKVTWVSSGGIPGSVPAQWVHMGLATRQMSALFRRAKCQQAAPSLPANMGAAGK
ncbi:hypothetical protein SKAU_G00248000 [Synaphobranchus kaupii]|uniref:Uncharacterized protein n=1 Tax=Synaphobranchus kaupii TaxID=118154 RepID=A0A9Q1IRK8_SYNKA|nr:hypothetical protein SKAU_G00248000 [Synaphobranchus kaupii]